MPKLSNRLQTIANMVPIGSIVADIGTDHALLPIYLVEQKIAKKVYAIDNKSEPLLAAKRNISLHQTSLVVPLLHDGLDNLPLDCDTIILAGLGSGSILSILQQHPDKLKNIHTLIVQPNIGVESIRQWATERHWKIVDERLIKDDSFIYDIIKLEPGKQLLSSDEVLFGPILMKQSNNIFFEKWTQLSHHYQKIHDSIPLQHKNKDYYHTLIQTIQKMLKHKKDL